MTLTIGDDVYRVEEVYSWHAKMCACRATFGAAIEGTYWEKLWDHTHAAHNRAWWDWCKSRGCGICNAPESAKQEER